MRRACLAVLTTLVGCHSPEYKIYQEQQAKFASNGSDSSGEQTTTTDDTGPESTSTSTSEGMSATETADSTGPAPPMDTGTGTDAPTDTTDSPPVGEDDKPVIVSVELPDTVYTAGPVPLSVQTVYTASVRVTLDGADAGPLLMAGGGLFIGELPVRGAVDNGSHAIEVIATQGEYEDRRPDSYDVKAPKPGAEAWTIDGPPGSRNNRVAVSPAGHLVEVGHTEIDGVPYPTLRTRSSLTGAELEPAKLLDTREGAAVDVAVLADGRMWVAMNVREQGKDSRARIALLDANGDATGAELTGAAGRLVRGIAADASGGCFAVGVAGVMGDWDIAYWRIDAAGVPTLGDTFDYQPPEALAHSFVDLANDVVIDGDVVYMVGTSTGEHDNFNLRTRGIIATRDLHTGEAIAPVVVAPVLVGDDWQQSAFFGAAPAPGGVLVTGYGSDKTSSKYRIETSFYSAAGLRTWHKKEAEYDKLAYGSDVVLDSQGRVLVAGAVTQNGKLRGYVFGRLTDEDGTSVFEHWFPGAGTSEGLGVVRDGFDRIFVVGYITANGSTLAQSMRIHG